MKVTMKSLPSITWNIWPGGHLALPCLIHPKPWYIPSIVYCLVTVANCRMINDKDHFNPILLLTSFLLFDDMIFFQKMSDDVLFFFIKKWHRWLRLRCRNVRKVYREQPTHRPLSWAEKKLRCSARREGRKSDAKPKKPNATERILCSISVAPKSRSVHFRLTTFSPLHFWSLQLLSNSRTPLDTISNHSDKNSHSDLTVISSMVIRWLNFFDRPGSFASSWRFSSWSSIFH